MLYAVVAGVVTLVVLVVVVALVLRRVRFARTEQIKTKPQVNSIETVVVAEAESSPFGTGPVEVTHEEPTLGTAGEAMRGRFVAVGVFAAAVFGSLTAKLWSMQVMQQEDFSRKATENLYTTVYRPAPRGQIFDYDGNVLVKNRTSFTVLATADVADNREVVGRLSALLGIPAGVVRQRIMNAASGAQNTRVVATDVSLRNLAFISEHAEAFPGVSCEDRTAREYPYGTLCAHVLGYAGTVSEDELKSPPQGRDIQSGDMVGKNGVESSFDSVLAGDHGTRTLLTDASGTILDVLSETEPTRGNDVHLTIRGPVQYIADQTMAAYIVGGVGTAATVVCLDARDGSIIALSNYPTYAPETFVGGISQDVWDQFNTEASHYPLMNRAIAGAYPAASTFKAFTAMAGLERGVIDDKSKSECGGIWTGFGEDFPQACWLLSGHGIQDVVYGIANSCDVFFYDLAKGFWDRREELGNTSMQDYVQQYGFGRTTGIDLSGEAAGRIPTPEWKAEYFKDAPEESAWRGGDLTNMVIGQGYVLATPLQIACGYAGIATGKVFRPHVLKEVRNSLGQVVVRHEPEVLYEPEMDARHIKWVREGLRKVMTVNDYDRFFGDFRYEVCGKTGTAEVFGKQDYSLFACYAPADDPKFVVACICEEGPTTITSAIPMAAEVLMAAMDYDYGDLEDEYLPLHFTTQIADPDAMKAENGESDDDAYDDAYADYAQDYSYAPEGRMD